MQTDKLKELGRKLVHMVFGFCVLIVVYFLHASFLPVLFLSVFLFGVFISFLIKCGIELPIFSFFVSLFGRRSEEVPGYGTLAFFFGAFIASLLAFISKTPNNVLIVSLLPLVFGDGVATIIGINFGKHKLFLNQEKSLEGSLAFFCVSLISVYLYTANLFASFLIAMISSIVEALSFEDNITIPVVSSFIAALVL